jgi:ABC-type Na+ transport system ATPase subunit NatA
MITLKNLSLEHGDFYLSAVSLQVRSGEIYFLLNRQNLSNDFLFNVLSGFRVPDRGEIFYDDCRQILFERPLPAAFINKIVDVADFETEARIGDWIDFLCRGGDLRRENVLQTLMVLNFNEINLRKKVRDLTPEIFRQVYLALCLAPDAPNIVINDFIKGTEKSLEMKFNKLLWEKKAAGRAILYLGNDIIYAAEIADRVGFIKNGHLLFEADAADIKDMDIKDLYYKFLN